MKRILLLTFVLTQLSLSSQTKEIVLNIHHRVDGISLSDSAVGVNNLGNQFKYSRLQYYIDDIEVIYDQGDTFSYPEVHLINALSEEISTINLGSLDFSSVSAIRFAIGVGPDLNNLDPTVYPTTHPLAPKFPSMHWGWTSGYRFVCAEGTAGASFNQTFELHGLGNANYALQTIVTAGSLSSNDTMLLDIEADYAELTRNIPVSNGTISHGETGNAFQALKNLNNNVFRSSEGNSALSREENVFSLLNIFPNPSNGEVYFKGINGSEVTIYNSLGSMVKQFKVHGTKKLNLKDSGIYLCVISHKGLTKTSKIIVR